MIRVKVDLGGTVHELDLMAHRIEDLDAPLRKFGRYLSEKMRKRFAQGGPGWQQLDPQTLKRLAGTSAGAFTLKRGGLRAGYLKGLRGYFKGRMKTGAVDASVLHELRRLERKAADLKDPRAQKSRLAAGVTNNALARLEKQIERRAEAMAAQEHYARTPVVGRAPKGARTQKTALQTHRILGRIDSMIQAKVKNGVLEVGILKDSPLAVHDSGGPAGKGATEPARPFAILEANDLPVLAEMVETHAIGKALRGG